MDQKLDSGTKRYDSGTNGTEPREKRIDLSLPQVAGSALAAIAAAILASQLNVYGTIIGAGVVSVIATCGGSVFHYLFRRTGHHLRGAADGVRPRARQVPVVDDRTLAIRKAAGHRPSAGHDGLPDTLDVLDADYGEATTHGKRRRGWKRPVLTAVAVFAVAMVCITGYELAAGHDLAGDARTTIGSVVGGGGGDDGKQTPSTPATTPSDSTGSGDTGQGSAGTGGGADPATSPGTGGDGRGSADPNGQAPSGDPSPGSSQQGSTGQTPSAPTPTPSTSATGSGGTQQGPDIAPSGAGD
ncbi:hypothetical protein [Streptomyces sp. NRRL F-5126]|uniref:hypothetical protein n=1 Tax=Streptomyces sp. NRRL F-5126 TaxID=1463857 RepID=UPI00055E18F2|nr:hypothetical protein [Streptomyces sp. NRRL F-5126]